jgi:hypothetical protein
MSSSVTIKFPSIAENHATGQGRATATAWLVRLGRSSASFRQRCAERRVEQSLQALGHPGVLADFQQALLRR